MAVEQLLPNARPVLAAVRHQVVDGHPVDARSATVAHHARVRGDQILSPHDLLDECQSLVPAWVFACRVRLTLDARTSLRAAASLLGS